MSIKATKYELDNLKKSETHLFHFVTTKKSAKAWTIKANRTSVIGCV